jgi:hypothetical protein
MCSDVLMRAELCLPLSWVNFLPGEFSFFWGGVYKFRLTHKDPQGDTERNFKFLSSNEMCDFSNQYGCISDQLITACANIHRLCFLNVISACGLLILCDRRTGMICEVVGGDLGLEADLL